MSIFRYLRDICIWLEEDLQNESSQIFSSGIGLSFNDEISNKMQDISLFTAKIRLLHAKYLSMDPNCPRPRSEEATLSEYEDAAIWKVIEQQTVTSITQFTHVRTLITAPDAMLNPDMMQRKEEIISLLKEYRIKEEYLREMDAMLTKADIEHIELRSQWDSELGALRDVREQASMEEDVGQDGPLYRKLQTLVNKMELMRWLMSRLVTSRSNYNWLADPERRLAALKITREPNNLEAYTT